MELLYYCQVAEGLIYAFGLFGASVLYEEALVISSILHINMGAIWSDVGVIIYWVALLWGLSLNLKFRKDWCFDNKFSNNETSDTRNRFMHVSRSTKLRRWHYLTVVVASAIGGIWGGLLFVSNCDNLNGFVVLFLLTIYYAWWIIFRAVFAPMRNVRIVLVDPNKLSRD